MTLTRRKKLIEVALPLKKINQEASREKINQAWSSIYPDTVGFLNKPGKITLSGARQSPVSYQFNLQKQ